MRFEPLTSPVATTVWLQLWRVYSVRSRRQPFFILKRDEESSAFVRPRPGRRGHKSAVSGNLSRGEAAVHDSAPTGADYINMVSNNIKQRDLCTSNGSLDKATCTTRRCVKHGCDRLGVTFACLRGQCVELSCEICSLWSYLQIKRLQQ